LAAPGSASVPPHRLTPAKRRRGVAFAVAEVLTVRWFIYL